MTAGNQQITRRHSPSLSPERDVASDRTELRARARRSESPVTRSPQPRRAYATDGLRNLSSPCSGNSRTDARHAAGLRALRFHDLRHTYGSLLAAAGIDLVSIQAVMGHSALSTTSRYLRARPASEQAALFTRAFEPTVSEALHA
jgi:integrase